MKGMVAQWVMALVMGMGRESIDEPFGWLSGRLGCGLSC